MKTDVLSLGCGPFFSKIEAPEEANGLLFSKLFGPSFYRVKVSFGQ